MIRSTVFAFACAALAAPVHAAGVEFVQTGTLTSTPVDNEVIVNGRTYPVLRSKALDEQLARVQQGDHVDVILDSPAATPGTRVKALVLHGH